MNKPPSQTRWPEKEQRPSFLNESNEIMTADQKARIVDSDFDLTPTSPYYYYVQHLTPEPVYVPKRTWKDRLRTLWSVIWY